MRLSTFEKDQILSVLQKHISCPFDLYLFGSRTDDAKLGGDLDLLLVLEQNSLAEIALKKHYLLAEIKTLIGDQRIDLSIKDRQHLLEDSFYLSIQAELVKLTSDHKA